MRFVPSLHRERWVTLCVSSVFVFSILWRGGKSLDATWFLAGTSCAVVLLSFLSGKPKRGIPLQLWLPVFALLAWSIFSYIQSSTANYGLDEVLRTGCFTLFFFWAVRFIQQEEGRLIGKRLHDFVRLLSILTLVACSIGMLVYIFQPVNRFVGTFFDSRFHTDYWPNAWASYLLLVWPILLYWISSFQERLATRSQYVASFVLRTFILSFVLAAFFLSYSRGGLLAFLCQLALWAAIVSLQSGSIVPWKKIIIKCTTVAVFAVVIFLLANAFRSSIYDVVSVEEKVTFSADEGNSSVSERSSFWLQAITLANAKPLFGWGPYSFRFVQPHLQTSVLATSDHPHNIFLKYAAELGWPAALMFIVLLAIIFRAAIDKELRNSTKEASLGLLLIIGLAGLLSHSLIDYNLQFVGIGLTFWVLLGFLAGYAVDTTNRTVPLKISQATELVVVFCILLVAVYEGVFLVTSSIGRHAEAADDYRKALVWYQRSENEQFSRDLHLSRAAIHIRASEYTTAERILWQYFQQNSQDARAWKLQGDSYAGMFQFEKAIASYEVAYDYGKYNDIGITYNLITSYLQNNQRDVIDSRKVEFDELIKEYANAIMLNTHFIALSPNVEQFIELCELFVDLYPEEAPVYIVLAAKADDHAKLERSRIESRPPGFLW